MDNELAEELAKVLSQYKFGRREKTQINMKVKRLL
jgi:hypothetical protein